MRERPILFSSPMVRAILDGRKTQTRRLVAPKVIEFFDAEDARVVWSETGHSGPGWYVYSTEYPDEGAAMVRCPFGQTGDRLWVRETWARMCSVADPYCYCNEEDVAERHFVEYRADTGNKYPGDWPPDSKDEDRPCWRPSIHMPRWASRITLEVTNIRVERLQAITEEDAIAEGVEPTMGAERWSAYSRQMDGYPEFLAKPSADDIERLGLENVRHHPPQVSTSARARFRALWDSINADRAPWASNPWVWVVGFRRLEVTHG